MKQGKSGHSVKSAAAPGFPASRSKGKGEDTEGKLVPLLAQPLTAVDPSPSAQSPSAPERSCQSEQLLAGQERERREGRQSRTGLGVQPSSSVQEALLSMF